MATAPRGANAAAAFHVLHHDSLPGALAHPCRNPPRGRVRKPAGGKSDDEIHALVRIVRALRLSARQACGHRGETDRKK